ncbi:carboxypeptidase regulatory-like domain-containing protein [Microbacterium sp. PMB16]|uniref:carboxypeptidase regulatory-like domain-containing protein n=1 Tax=Microbacterium sp. PMB16 TaxID=3120157 RepID=UPI003F4CAAC5
MMRRRGMLRAVVGGMAAFALALGGATAAVAADEPTAGTGSISGTVTSKLDGAALAGVDVHAESDDGLGSADAVTDASGAYTLDGLVDGDYVVRFSADDFATEYWDDARESWRAQRVTVTDGSASAEIDAALSPTPTASITGTVTREDDGSSVAGVTVSASGLDGAWSSTTTDDTGVYTLSSLAAGSYVVSFIPSGTDLKREYWQDTFDYSSATPVVIADGATVSDIDASMVVGAAIEGVVTREDDGSPLGNVAVHALDERNEIVEQAHTDATGKYTLGGLPAGSYRLQFLAPDAELLSEYWKNNYSWSFATQIAVTEKQTVSGVDAALATAGFLSGTVTNGADGEPLFTTVLLYDVNNRFDIAAAYTDDLGKFRIGVPAGTYKILFRSSGLAEEYWEDAPGWDAATEVTVSAGGEVDGIDAALDNVAQITGTVVMDADEESKVVVEAWADGVEVRSSRANPITGEYSLLLPEGSYVLKASATFASGKTTAKPQFFDGVDTAAEATPVVLTPGTAVGDIDFTLVPDTTGPEPKPTLALSVGSIRAGKDIAISGTGFEPGAKIAFELHSDPIALGTLTADAGGVLKGSLRIPASAPAGKHTLVALSGSTVIASTAVSVTAAATPGGPDSGGAATPAGGLASTGMDAPVAVVAIGLMLAVMGGLLVRRRRVES